MPGIARASKLDSSNTMTMCGGFVHRAGLVARPPQDRSLTVGVGFQHAARDQIADRGDAGARELGEIVLGVKLLPRVARDREREPDEAAEARGSAEQPQCCRRTRSGSKYQVKISATSSSTRSRSPTLASSGGKIFIRNANVSASITMRSTKLTVISSTPCLNCDSRISSTSQASDSAAATAGRPQQHDPAEIEEGPGEQERELRDRRDSRSTSRIASAARCSTTKSAMRPACARRPRRRTGGWSGRQWRAAWTYVPHPGTIIAVPAGRRSPS